MALTELNTVEYNVRPILRVIEDCRQPGQSDRQFGRAVGRLIATARTNPHQTDFREEIRAVRRSLIINTERRR